MKTFLMFTIVLILYSEIWVTSFGTVRKNGINYDEDSDENHTENDEDRKRELTNGNSPDLTNLVISEVANWPSKDVKYGQVSSIALDSAGNVYVFHRGNRTWNANSFHQNNTYKEIYLGPISPHTVAVIHPKSGVLLKAWGSNMFYMPHGITVDKDNNVWITDVALHQVFKFPPIMAYSANSTIPLLALGAPFLPGSNLSLFCKPSAVAVLPSGEFFVSDGYCNSRIIKFSPEGNLLLSWGRSTIGFSRVPAPPYHFQVPHDLTLMDDKNSLCVSDRENGRIQCFHTSNGTFVRQIQLKEIGSRVFSASYSSANGGIFYIVNGPDNFNSEVHGSVFDADSDRYVKKFQPNNTTFKNPHDVIISANGTELYVCELNPYRVWKFDIKGLYLVPAVAPVSDNKLSILTQSDKLIAENKSAGTVVMAMIITAAVLCFGAALLVAALIYSRARTRGCSGHCKNPKWLVGGSTVEGFKLGNFLGQQHQGFIKLNNLEESDEEETNSSPTFA